MTETTTTLDDIAREAYGWFETARRATGDTDTGPREDGEEFTRLRDGAPQWVLDLVHAAHGDMLPDDWKYDAVRSALGAIGEVWDGSPDVSEAAESWADGYVDVYNARLTAWLASNLTRGGYVDEAIEEYGYPDRGIFGAIAMGQYAEAREVFESVVASLMEQADARVEKV